MMMMMNKTIRANNKNKSNQSLKRNRWKKGITNQKLIYLIWNKHSSRQMVEIALYFRICRYQDNKLFNRIHLTCSKLMKTSNRINGSSSYSSSLFRTYLHNSNSFHKASIQFNNNNNKLGHYFHKWIYLIVLHLEQQQSTLIQVNHCSKICKYSRIRHSQQIQLHFRTLIKVECFHL